MLVQEAKTQRENFDAVVATIKPVLDYVDLETATQPDGRRQRSDTIIQRCKAAWENFKSFNRDAHYLAIDLQSIGGGFAKELSDAETQQLEDEVEDATKNLAGNIDLFGETDGNDGA